MDIINYYIAKDGTRFEDPLECQDYERKLDHPNGTVGRAKIDLAELGKQKFVHGTLKVHHIKTGKRGYHLYCTRRVDSILKNYVNLEELDGNKLWITSTFADVLKDLDRYDDDDLCEYDFIYSDEKNFDIIGLCRTENSRLWDILRKELSK